MADKWAIRIDVMYYTGFKASLHVPIEDLDEARAGIVALGVKLREDFVNFGCIDAITGEYKSISLAKELWVTIEVKLVNLLVKE